MRNSPKEKSKKLAPELLRREFLVLGAAAGSATLLPSAATAQTAERAPDAPETGDARVAQHRVETPGPNGVVTAGHPLAATTGLRILMSGGSASDAAVAAMAVLNVVEPWASGIGGNGFATVFEKSSGTVQALKFAGAAPRAMDPASDPKVYDWGVKAAITPGAFGGWIELLRRGGRLSLKDVFGPAIAYARNGHPVDPSIARTISRMQERLAEHPTTAEIYLAKGAAPEPRSILRNEPLAQTMESLVQAEQESLASDGDRDKALLAAFDYFYKGPIAREVDRFFRESGGWLRYEDLAAFAPDWTNPVATTYRGYTVYGSPVTSRGGLELCIQASLIERFNLPDLKQGSALVTHLMAEAIKFAKADVYAYTGDPAFVNVPNSALLSKAYAEARSRRINPASASVFPNPTDLRAYDPAAPAPPPFPELPEDSASRFSDTTSLTVMDADGNTVVVTPTLGGGFGTGVVAGSTGFLLNNGMRLGSTSPYRNNANFVGPGKIPILNNSPTVIMRNGRLFAAYGSPGGETIGQSQFQAMVNLVDYGMGIQEAIEAPRFAVKAVPNFYLPGTECVIQLEARFDKAVAAELRALGHGVEMVGPFAIGSVQGIRKYEGGAVMAGADPRRMAMAAGW